MIPDQDQRSAVAYAEQETYWDKERIQWLVC